MLEASGEYILFVDPDDYVDSNWLDIVKKNISSSPDMIIMGFKRIVVDENETIVNKNVLLPICNQNFFNNADVISILLPKYLGYSVDNILAWGNEGKNLSSQLECGTVWRNVYKREQIIINNVRFNEEILLNEDSMFNAWFLCSASHVKILDDAPYNYIIRQHGALNTIVSASNGVEKLIKNKMCLQLERSKIVTFLNQNSGVDYDIKDYAGSSVLSILELMSKTRISEWHILKQYIESSESREAIAIMPFTHRVKFAIPLLMLKIRQDYLLFLMIRTMNLLGIKIAA